ncbi:MAG: hypothetical protein IT293_11115 [Deltaproteobacteria bacterium]|nr:hypothetical protein [Deltaproteobacteria bacterium]
MTLKAMSDAHRSRFGLFGYDPVKQRRKLRRSGQIYARIITLLRCFIVHRGLPNASPDRLRLSADFRYQPAA